MRTCRRDSLSGQDTMAVSISSRIFNVPTIKLRKIVAILRP